MGGLIQPVGTGVANVVLSRIRVENNSAGIRIDGTGNTALINIHIRDSVVAGSANNGITAISPAAGAPVTLTIDRTSIISNAAVGLNVNAAAASGAEARSSGSAIRPYRAT